MSGDQKAEQRNGWHEYPSARCEGWLWETWVKVASWSQPWSEAETEETRAPNKVNDVNEPLLQNVWGPDGAGGEHTGAGVQVWKNRRQPSSCPKVAQQLCNTLIPSLGNVYLHISEICFWHWRHAIPVLNFLLQLQEAWLLPYTTCKVITDVAKQVIYTTWCFGFWYFSASFTSLICCWHVSVMVACLIHWIIQPHNFTFIGFSLDNRSDCIIGDGRLCFCAYVTATEAVLPVCFQFIAERIKLFDPML